jgi:hypothetical protein
MIKLFTITFFGTFIITRIIATLFHDFNCTKLKKDKSKTLTGIIRRKSGRDIHHIHFGFLILILTLIIYLLGKFEIILFAIGSSLILDQLIPWISLKFNSIQKINYFKIKGILSAIILHILFFILILYFTK